MIEEVFISGQLGKAYYKENELFFSLDAKEKRQPKECRIGEVFSVLKSGFEFEVTQDKYINTDQIQSALTASHLAHRALTLTIGGLDSELSDDTRLLSIEAAEELLSDDYINKFVKRRLLAFPLPNQADVNGAISFSNQTKAKTVHSIFDKVAKAQSYIKKIADISNEVMLKFFDTEEERENAIKILIGIGFFGDVISSIAFEDAEKLDSLIISYGLNSELKKKLNKGTQILNQIKKRISSEIAPEAEKIRYAKDENKHKPARKKSPAIDRIYELITTFEKEEKKRKEKSSSIEIKDRIDKQIDAIKSSICKGRLHQASKYIYELVKFNLTFSNKEQVAKTLCNISKTAMDYNKIDFAEQLIKYSYLLGVYDAVIWCAHAELYKLKAQLDQALVLYNETIDRFPDDVVAQTGKAEVLKAKGCKAEVLKAKGLFDEALRLYNEIIERFPDNVVARNGKCSLLILLDRAEEARSILLLDHPISHQDWIGYHIIAMSYLKEGDFDAAIKRFKYGLKKNPWFDQKEYFSTALALAKIKAKEFAEAEKVLLDNLFSQNIIQTQCRLLLLTHARAGMDKSFEASNTLALLKEAENPRILSLKDCLTKRFELGGESIQRYSKSELAYLDRKIEEEEFFFALAA